MKALGGGAAAVILAACGVDGSAQSSPSPSTTSRPTDTPLPAPSSTPVPSLRDRIGQMLLVGFRGLTLEDAGEIVADIRDRNLGGILLFDTDQPTHSAVRNVESPAQLTALVAGLRSLARTPTSAHWETSPSRGRPGSRSPRRSPRSGSTSTWRRWST
jgi:beta-N-acetylhexosaminidase